MNSSDAQVILGLNPGYTEEELKKAYKKLSKKYHPDIAGAGATTAFIKVKKAYDLLSSSSPKSGNSLLTHRSIFTIVKQ